MPPNDLDLAAIQYFIILTVFGCLLTPLKLLVRFQKVVASLPVWEPFDDRFPSYLENNTSTKQKVIKLSIKFRLHARYKDWQKDPKDSYYIVLRSNWCSNEVITPLFPSWTQLDTHVKSNQYIHRLHFETICYCKIFLLHKWILINGCLQYWK